MNASPASSTHPARGMTARLLARQRQRMIDAFVSFRADAPHGSVLLVTMVGMPAPSLAEPANRVVTEDAQYRLHWPNSPVPLRPAEDQGTPGQTRPQFGGTRLPYANGAFDWIFCAEAIEHVGSADRQQELIAEMFRVARRGVFLTTSNRRHPLEFNTGLPLLHWLPDRLWRFALKVFGKGEWQSSARLNLLGSEALYRMSSGLPGAPDHDVGHKRIFGIKAHYFLMIRKQQEHKPNQSAPRASSAV